MQRLSQKSPAGCIVAGLLVWLFGMGVVITFWSLVARALWKYIHS